MSFAKDYKNFIDLINAVHPLVLDHEKKWCEHITKAKPPQLKTYNQLFFALTTAINGFKDATHLMHNGDRITFSKAYGIVCQCRSDVVSVRKSFVRSIPDGAIIASINGKPAVEYLDEVTKSWVGIPGIPGHRRDVAGYAFLECPDQNHEPPRDFVIKNGDELQKYQCKDVLLPKSGISKVAPYVAPPYLVERKIKMTKDKGTVYLRVHTFDISGNTYADWKRVIPKFASAIKHAKRVVVDIRENHGGYVRFAEFLASILFDIDEENDIVATRASPPVRFAWKDQVLDKASKEAHASAMHGYLNIDTAMRLEDKYAVDIRMLSANKAKFKRCVEILFDESSNSSSLIFLDYAAAAKKRHPNRVIFTGYASAVDCPNFEPMRYLLPHSEIVVSIPIMSQLDRPRSCTFYYTGDAKRHVRKTLLRQRGQQKKGSGEA